MATLQRINQALLIELRSQQDTNQMLQAQELQQIVGQKLQQDNLKSLFLTANGYQQSFQCRDPATNDSWHPMGISLLSNAGARMDFLILIKNGCGNLTATAAPSLDSLGLHMVLALRRS